MKKFKSDDYKKDASSYQDHISINGNVIIFSNLAFYDEVKINSDSLKIGEACFSVESNIIKFDHCTLENHFNVNYNDNNKIKINTIEISDTIFKKDFTVYKAEINFIKIKNVDFESLSEFNEVTFLKEFDLKEITYKGFTLFDRCVFHTKAEFEYIVFEKFTSFRGTTFNNGLNLDYTSADKEINFFGIKGLEIDDSKKETSQETYRIIKQSFEKIGNKIEANKYHALELDQKRRELEKNKWNNKKDYLVFKLHSWSSEHSTNWFRALIWILLFGFATNVLNNSFWYILGVPIAYLISEKIHNSIEGKIFLIIGYFTMIVLFSSSIYFDDVFKYMNVIAKTEEFNTCFLMTLNKVALGYLYYQFLTAVRKDTRK